MVINELYYRDEIPFQNISSTLFGLLYITVPFSVLNYLSFNAELNSVIGMNEHYSILVQVFIILWCNDTFAYVVGRLIGKHKLFETLSPKKTIEGMFGGVLFSIIAGYLISYFTDSSVLHWIILSVIISILGMFGDLSESYLKRAGNIKDSGNISTGHGGVLDRFDGILLAAPVVFAYLVILSKI